MVIEKGQSFIKLSTLIRCSIFLRRQTDGFIKNNVILITKCSSFFLITYF